MEDILPDAFQVYSYLWEKLNLCFCYFIGNFFVYKYKVLRSVNSRGW
jgi:hypothetical protein